MHVGQGIDVGYPPAHEARHCGDQPQSRVGDDLVRIMLVGAGRVGQPAPWRVRVGRDHAGWLPPLAVLRGLPVLVRDKLLGLAGIVEGLGYQDHAGVATAVASPDREGICASAELAGYVICLIVAPLLTGADLSAVDSQLELVICGDLKQGIARVPRQRPGLPEVTDLVLRLLDRFREPYPLGFGHFHRMIRTVWVSCRGDQQPDQHQ